MWQVIPDHITNTNAADCCPALHLKYFISENKTNKQNKQANKNKTKQNKKMHVVQFSVKVKMTYDKCHSQINIQL